MKTKALLSLVLFTLLFTACKKGNTDADAAASFQSNLTSGTSSWLFGATTTTYYDKNNAVVQTVNMSQQDIQSVPQYWMFKDHNVLSYNLGVYPASNKSVSTVYSISVENGKTYLTEGYSYYIGMEAKWQVLSSDNTTISLIVTVPISSSSNAPTNSDHATVQMQVVKI